MHFLSPDQSYWILMLGQTKHPCMGQCGFWWWFAPTDQSSVDFIQTGVEYLLLERTGSSNRTVVRHHILLHGSVTLNLPPKLPSYVPTIKPHFYLDSIPASLHGVITYFTWKVCPFFFPSLVPHHPYQIHVGLLHDSPSNHNQLYPPKWSTFYINPSSLCYR